MLGFSRIDYLTNALPQKLVIRDVSAACEHISCTIHVSAAVGPEEETKNTVWLNRYICATVSTYVQTVADPRWP